ncbi:MAG: hypothetical protein PHV99_00705 [Candidatus Pacebacteria bacterium]|nr:hypothetical protein [Candidatus Paceibacterota bacterium]
MSFLENLFHKEKKIESVVLIDISTSSVAGAYATFASGEQPTLHYLRRLPVEMHEGESDARAMLRALKILGDTLVREGAPALLRVTGTGRADSVLVSVDAPWEKTSVRTEHFEQDEPFTFTKEMVRAALEKASFAPPEQLLADESVIGTTLNGYQTRDPYDKEANRAAVIILTSLINKRVAEGVKAIMRGVLHAEDIFPIAGSSLRYQAIRTAFPHETDALIIDATGRELTSLSLVRKSLLVNITEMKERTENSVAWTRSLTDTLKTIAQRFPLPRTVFLLAREPELSILREALLTAKLGSLWLSDNPPKITSILGSHVSTFVRQATTNPADLSLLLMALFRQNRTPDEAV